MAMKHVPKNSGEERLPAKVKNFAVMSQSDVPQGREGKHKGIVTRILDDLEQLKERDAIRIRLDELPDTKENIRAALSRAVHQRGMDIVTSSDDQHLYIWHAKKNRTKQQDGASAAAPRNGSYGRNQR